MNYDCIFIHTPKFNHYFHPLNSVGFVNIIASGLLSMADVLAKNGYKVKIFHMGVEKLKNPRIDFESFFKNIDSKIFGLSLQWHYQTYDVLKIAEIIRKVHPNSFIVLGGITASYFYKEIMERANYVDAIVIGEGEIPILRLTEEITSKRYAFENVPNLVYRKGEGIIYNPQTYTATDKELSDFSFADLNYLESYERYKDIQFFTKYNNKREANYIYRLINHWLSPPHYVILGRGCPYSCSFCAGGYNFKNILKRQKVGLKSIESVLVDTEKFVAKGIKRIIFTHYYHIYKEHYAELLRRCAAEFKDISITFDCWGLPSTDIIESFSLLPKGSTLVLTIYSLSESVRALNKIHSFTNDELFNFIKYANKKNVRIKLILMDNLPFENNYKKEIKSCMVELSKINKSLLVFSLPTELTPGSLMYLEPERFEIERSLNNFDDFYEYSSKSYFTPGYNFKGMTEKEMQLIKCKESCLINPLYGRLVCRILHKITK